MKNSDLPKETPNSSTGTTAAKRPSLKLNALSNWITVGVSVAIGFFLTPAIFAHLGEKRFGMWVLVSSVVGYFGLLRLGVGTAVLRYVPLFRGKGDRDGISATVSAAMALYTAAGIAIFVVSFIFANVIADFFEAGRELAVLIRLFGLAAALECPALIFDAAIKGYEGFLFANLVSIFCAIVRALMLFGCIFMGYGLVAMGWVIVGVTLVGLVANRIVFKICCSDVKLNITKIGLSVLKKLVVYGLIIMVESWALLLTFQSPNLIIGKVVSLEAVGFFGVVVLLMRYYRHLIFATSTVVMPRFSYLSGQSANKKIERLFFRGSVYVMIVVGAGALLLWIVGPSFLKLWIKNENISQVFPALIILTGGTLVWLSHRISIDLLYGLGKQTKLAVFAMVEGISVLVLSLVLSYKYGLTGAAIGVSVPLILVRGIVQTVYVCRVLKVGFWKYYSHCILKVWIIIIVLGVASRCLGVANYANNWLLLTLVSGLLVLAYGAGVYVIALDTNERRLIKYRVLVALGYFSRVAK